MQADGLLGLEALVKLVALQHLRNGEVRREADGALVAQLAQPLGVVADLGRLLVEDFEDLLLVGLGVGVNLLARQRLAGHVAPGGVADQRGKVADQEDDRVAELLKVAQLAHQHGVAQVQVGRRGIEAGFHAQRAAGFAALFKALAQVGDADDLRRAFLQQIQLFVDGQKLAHAVFQYKVRQLRFTAGARRTQRMRLQEHSLCALIAVPVLPP